MNFFSPVKVQTAYMPHVRVAGKRRFWAHEQTTTPCELVRLFGLGDADAILDGEAVNTGVAIIRRVA